MNLALMLSPSPSSAANRQCSANASPYVRTGAKRTRIAAAQLPVHPRGRRSFLVMALALGRQVGDGERARRAEQQ